MFLEALSEDEKTLIVSLPYRAGVWVSLADEKGAGAGRAQELQTIEQVIARLSRGMFASAFVHEVLAETHARRDQWPAWSLQVGTVPEDARQAVNVLIDKVMPPDAEAYVQTVMNIAYETAYAFREFDAQASIPIRIWVSFKLMWEAVMRKINPDYRMESMANISLAEDQAIGILAAALTLAPAMQEAS